MAIRLACLVLQSADRAVLVYTASGDRVEIIDPAVLRRLESLMKDDRQTVAGADWTVSLYHGKTLMRELKVLTAGSRQPIAAFLLDQDRIRRVFGVSTSNPRQVGPPLGVRAAWPIGPAEDEPSRYRIYAASR